ncbi:MAG: ABC transporter ATP-binding protein [Clostridiales bacterium]|nr:ABC transporter ATP-binding protein [Clostridiales bacterium]
MSIGQNIKSPSKKHSKRSFGSIIRMIKYMMQFKYLMLCIFAVVIVSNLIAIQIPVAAGRMVDVMSEGMEVGAIDYIALGQHALQILAIALIVCVLGIIQNKMMLNVAQKMVLRLRHDVFTALTRLPVSFFDKNTKGNIMSVVTVDVGNISDTVSSDLITLLSGAVTVGGVLFKMLEISPALSSIFIITVPAMFITARKISKNARRLFREKKNCFGALCGYTEEMVTAQKTVKVYGIEDYNNERFRERSKQLKLTGQHAEFVSSTMMPSMNFINNINFIFVCIVGAFLKIMHGTITIGDIAAFVQYSKKFSAPIVDTANIINMWQATLAACDRVFSIIDHPIEPGILEEEKKFVSLPEKIRGEVEFHDVSFSYIPGDPVLKNVNLKISPGEKVAVVGATGSGKTTLINLLLRFYDVDSGKITIDGIDIRDLSLSELRRCYALVLQDSWLFEGTVSENISYAAPHEAKSQEEIERICREISVHSFISSLPQGYDTVLRTDSGGLSQGQKQLINIARTFLCDPPIFILDEATSSVDTLTELNIKETTEKVTRGKTAIIIAHRLSTILNCDKIVVMRDGCIQEVGTHNELTAQNGLYHSLYQSQFASTMEAQ